MAAALVASDIYPAVNRFLLESGLAATLKKFEKETSAGDDAEAVGPRKKLAKAIRKIELTAAVQTMLGASVAAVVASDIYPAVNRFLVESGLTKSLKAFEKETTNGDEAEAVGPAKKLAKKIRKIDLTVACQTMLENGVATAGAAGAEEEAEPPKKKKRKLSAVEAESAPVQPEPAAEAPMSKKQKKQQQKEEKTSGIPFSRVDHSKWVATIKDSRLVDNTHEAKVKFGGSMGDSWGDAAAADMIKVKGKGFRKEMQKKKRASWRGGGELDQGVNSIPFPDSDDE
jgi:hypothetical protein